MMLLDSLYALGEASLRALWVPMAMWTALALVTLAVLRAWRGGHALVQYAARAALLPALPLGLLLLAALDFSVLAWLTSPAASSLPAGTPPGEMPLPLLPSEAAAPAFAWHLFHTLGLLTVVGGLLAAWQVGLLVQHAVALKRFVQRLPRQRSAPVQATADTLAAEMSLRRRVRVVVTAAPVVPMTYGALRPTVVLPATLLADAEALRLTLLHELIHVRQHDFLRQAAERLVAALFFVNPVVAWVRRAVAAHRERACDAEVLARPQTSARRYAALLLRFATPPTPGAHVLALSMAAPRHELLNRIQAMRTARDYFSRFSPRNTALLVGALLLATATFIVACTDLAGPNLAAEATPETFEVVEEMPTLIGGLEGLQQEIQYPEIASKAGVEGRVIVQFTVDEEGGVVDPKVVRGLGAGLDEEALRVLQTARFTPGRQGGEAVRVKMSIPFTFRLQAKSEPESSAKTTVEKPATVAPTEVPEGTFVRAEQMPKLIGGLESIQADLRYPTIASKAGIEGRVIVQFTVDETGRVVDPKVVRGLGGGLDEEALRAVEKARFEPGMNEGKAVPVLMSIPITFKLADDEGTSGDLGQTIEERSTETREFLDAIVEEYGPQLRQAEDRLQEGNTTARAEAKSLASAIVDEMIDNRTR